MAGRDVYGVAAAHPGPLAVRSLRGIEDPEVIEITGSSGGVRAETAKKPESTLLIDPGGSLLTSSGNIG
jgi:hypothetical protein